MGNFHIGIYAGVGVLNYSGMQSNVKHLASLAMAHPELKFIAMHMSYPYQHELLAAVKTLRNLYAEMSWVWIVDTESSIDFLKKVLCSSPVTKISGFGGDYSFVENTYGHLEIVRRGIAKALADLVESSWFDLDEAVTVGHYILRYSPEKIFSKKQLP